MELRKLLPIFIIALVLMKTFLASAQDNIVTLAPLEVNAMRANTQEKKLPGEWKTPKKPWRGIR